jgi:serine/threonine-protein kinase
LAIHNRAVTLAQRNQFAAALRDFNRVIELNPGLAVAYRNRAELLAALGRMEEAIADYSQAITALPEDATLCRARAHAYQRVGDFSRASSDITRAIQLSPRDPDALTQRGNLAAEQGKFDAAKEDFRRAIAIDANFADAYRSLGWLHATCPDFHFRDPKQALAAADEAARLSSDEDYLILDTLAAAHACGGNFEQAVEFEQKALTAAPPGVAGALEQRLALYQRGKAFAAAPARSDIRTASHEESNSATGAPTAPALQQPE